MPLTVIVRSGADEQARLTFDGTQRVVIGRGAGSDVRLPDPSVSHRHATLCSKGSDFVVVDEGSTNGTLVGGVPIAPRTSRLLRDGDVICVGRLRLEVRLEQTATTRDLAVATRDLALALVSRALAAAGADLTIQVRVVEGRDQGRALSLAEEEREYLVGRAPHCDLALADADVSREHLHTVRRGGSVFIRDLTAKNGTWVGDARTPQGALTVWRPAQMVKVGRTVLALHEPLREALERIERQPDETIPSPPPASAAPALHEAATEGESISDGSNPSADSTRAASASSPSPVTQASTVRRSQGWSVWDKIVIAAAVGVMALSLAGLLWLLRG